MQYTEQEQKQKAWVNQMLEEHHELRETLGEVRNFLGTPRPDPGTDGFHRWATAMSKQLIDLYDGLFRHFRSEEDCGVFTDLMRRYPRSSQRVENLRAEHAVLLEDLRELMTQVMEYSAGIAREKPQIRRKLEGIMQRLDAHEGAETELMQRMLYNDLGGGD
jgi:hypothetical protein